MIDWVKWKDSFSKAFAVEDGRDGLIEDDYLLLDKIAKWVVGRKLTAPAVLMLSTLGPLNFVGSSIMTFFQPMLGNVINPKEYQRLKLLLERRCVADLLVERIEKKENEKSKEKNMNNNSNNEEEVEDAKREH